jgi:arginine/serine-rich splicing factor 12
MAELLPAGDASLQLALNGAAKKDESSSDSDSDSDFSDDGNGAPGTIHTASCTLYGPGFSGGSANTELKFYIAAKDSRGRKLTTGGAIIIARLTPSLGVSHPDPVYVNISDQGNGTYVGTYTVPMRGNWQLHVQIDGEPANGSPFPLFFSPPPPPEPEPSIAEPAAAQGATSAKPILGVPAGGPTSQATSAMTAAATKAAAATNLAADAMARTLFFGNISPAIPFEKVKQFFNTLGTVANIKLVGDTRDVGIVEYKTADDAQSALLVNGMVLGDRPIKVQVPSLGPGSVAEGNPFLTMQIQQMQAMQASVAQSQQLAAQVSRADLIVCSVCSCLTLKGC